MAISKVIYKESASATPQVWMDDTGNTNTAARVFSGDTGTLADGTHYTGTYVPPASVTVEELEVTQNGTYTAPTGKAYSPVTVNVSGGGGGGSDAEDKIIARTISGSYVNSTVTQIGIYAFYSCTQLSAVSFSACTSIGVYAFSGCSSLTTASFPKCRTIGGSAFRSCTSLTTISFPECTSIDVYAFQQCTHLITANFPACTSIGNYAFSGCTSLTTASFPAGTSIGAYTFSACTSLTTVSFPVCLTVAANAFINCYNLATVSFPSCTSIGASAFRVCRKLLSAYFLGSSVPSLTNSNAFSSTPIAGYTTSTGGVYGSIYVRASLLTEFQSATNWTYYSDRMVGLTDAQIAAL